MSTKPYDSKLDMLEVQLYTAKMRLFKGGELTEYWTRVVEELEKEIEEEKAKNGAKNYIRQKDTRVNN